MAPLAEHYAFGSYYRIHRIQNAPNPQGFPDNAPSPEARREALQMANPGKFGHTRVQLT
jgi:hypothetical protein